MNTTDTPAAQTSVQQVDLNLDEFLGAPGADNIVVPSDNSTPDKPNFFSKGGTDMSFLDNVGDEDKKPDEESNDKTSAASAEEILKDLDQDLLPDEDDDQPEEPKKGGRPKTEKSGLVEFFKKRIESKEMFAFDDYDEEKQSLEDYLSTLGEKDYEELWQANIDNLKQDVASKTPQEFFESLPEELQYAAKYVMDGGQNLKQLFSALAQVEQVRDMDPSVDSDQEAIVRQYLFATNFGDDAEIAEEIETWKDLGVLEKKAKQFKPKLDNMQEEIVAAQLAEQEERKQQQEAAAEQYVNNVFDALRAGELNGLKLDKKTQAQLYTGLVKPQYPSISGRPTNLLGHLLEKYQFVEPNYPLIAEALWLLSDPDEYRNSLAKVGKNQAVEQTVRTLKTEQARKTASTTREDDEPRSRRIPRPNANFFKR